MLNNSQSLFINIPTLLLAFRSTLLALIPFMDTVKIKWRDEEAYDDWDEIASVLYKNMVQKSVENSSEISDVNQLAPYDLLLPSYNKLNYISVNPEHVVGQNLAFVRFSTKEQPFDSVACINVKSDFTTEENISYFSVDACKYSLTLIDTGEKITNLNVKI